MSENKVEIVIEGKDKLSGPAQSGGKSLGGLDKAAQSAKRSMESLGNTVSKMGMMLSLASLPIIGMGIAATKAAMDAVESENLFEVSMGGMAESARKWSENLRQQLGLNAYELRKNVSMFNVMFGSMGFGEQAAFGMSKGLTKLAYDFSSFYNLKPEEAFEKLRAGIVGETEPLRRLGINMLDTTIQAYALKKGIVKAGQEMSDAQKVVARYLYLMENTSKAQGDLARTMDSPTNQLRLFKAQLDETAIEAGQVFLPVLGKALTWLNKEGFPRVKDALDDFKRSWGEMSNEARNKMILTAGLLVAGGPLLKGLSIGIQGVQLFAGAFGLLPGAMKKGIVAAVGGLVIFRGQIGDIILSVSSLIAGLAKMIEYAKGFGHQETGLRNVANSLRDAGNNMKNLDVMSAVMGEGLHLLDPAFDQLIKKMGDLGLGEIFVSDQAKISQDALNGYGSAQRQASKDADYAIDVQALLRDALAAGGITAKDAGKKVEKLAGSVQGLQQALIASHPATLAIAGAITAWQRKVADVNLAIGANKDLLKAAQGEFQRMGDGLSVLNDKLGQTKQRLSDLAVPKLTGQTEAEKQILELEGYLKRIDLAKRSGRGLSDILREFPSALPKGFEWVANMGDLGQMEEYLNNLLQQMRLTKEFRFDEMLLKIKEAAEGTQAEMSWAEAMMGITATKGEISDLTAAVGAQEVAMKAQQAVMVGITGQGERLNGVLETLQDQLKGLEADQRGVNDALRSAYQWFLDDREQMILIGSEAARQAGIIDGKTRELLGSLDIYANGVSLSVGGVLLGMLDSYRRTVDDILIQVGRVPVLTPGVTGGTIGSSFAGAIPQAEGGAGVVTKPTLFLAGEAGPEAYWFGGANGRGPGPGSTTVQIYVQGSVVTERELVDIFRREIFRIQNRNINSGFAGT